MRKNNKQPLVSVIMPVYNGSEYVGEAIESILAQTYKNLEFIIVDDASVDRTSEVVLKYKRMYPSRIRLVRLKKNRGRGGDAAANSSGGLGTRLSAQPSGARTGESSKR